MGEGTKQEEGQVSERERLVKENPRRRLPSPPMLHSIDLSLSLRSLFCFKTHLLQEPGFNGWTHGERGLVWGREMIEWNGGVENGFALEGRHS